jgi:hypothetical protein
MKRRSLVLAALVLVMSLAGSTAGAATIVTTDSGDLGSFTLTNTGITSGVSHLSLALTSTESIETINGSPAVIPASFTTPITFNVTSTGGGTYSITMTSTPTKTFGTSSSVATLSYDFTTGSTDTARPDFLNLAGFVTALTTDSLTGYSFAQFSPGTGLNNFTLTATNFSGATNLAGVLTTSGASATGSGAFSESAAVPEPTSLTLLGVSMSGLFVGSRFFKRIRTA